jgi:hypothetical protein
MALDLLMRGALGGTRTPNLLIRRNLCGSPSPAALALACKNDGQWCALIVVVERPRTARIRPTAWDGVSHSGQPDVLLARASFSVVRLLPDAPEVARP